MKDIKQIIILILSSSKLQENSSKEQTSWFIIQNQAEAPRCRYINNDMHRKVVNGWTLVIMSFYFLGRWNFFWDSIQRLEIYTQQSISIIQKWAFLHFHFKPGFTYLTTCARDLPSINLEEKQTISNRLNLNLTMIWLLLNQIAQASL